MKADTGKGATVTDKKSPPLVTAPNQSPRDFRPWEILVAFYKPVKGVFMYQLAARQIADAEGWSDSQMEALEAEMSWAIANGLLPQRSRKTGMVIAPGASEMLTLVTVNDVNKWLEDKLKDDDVKYQWKLQSFATQPQPLPMPSPAQNAADPTPDPERRLTLLRKLGGSPKYARGEWKFTGIAALVANEKANGFKRCTEKTIRADLKEAAQAELEAKRAGVFNV